MLGERKRVWYLNKIFSTVWSDCNWRVLSLWHLYTRDDIFAHVKNATHTKNISCLRISVTCISNINCHFAAFEFQTLIFSNTDKFNFLWTETKQCCYYFNYSCDNNLTSAKPLHKNKTWRQMMWLRTTICTCTKILNDNVSMSISRSDSLFRFWEWIAPWSVLIGSLYNGT